jgi:hypothetical protein
MRFVSSRRTVMFAVFASLTIAFGLGGCGKDKSALSPTAPGDTAAVTVAASDDRVAQKAVANGVTIVSTSLSDGKLTVVFNVTLDELTAQIQKNNQPAATVPLLVRWQLSVVKIDNGTVIDIGTDTEKEIVPGPGLTQTITTIPNIVLPTASGEYGVRVRVKQQQKNNNGNDVNWGDKWEEALKTDSFKIAAPVTDTTPPEIAPSVVGTMGDNGWYTGDVTVSWTVVDNESAVTAKSGDATTVITEDTTGRTLTCTAVSAGGTSTKSVTIKRDATPPVISGSPAPAANAGGWNNTDVTVSFTATDATSGVAGYSGSTVLTAEGANQSVTGTARDNAGNTASATVGGINIDKTAPVVIIRMPAAPYFLNQLNLSATWTATDNLSGIAGAATGTIPLVTGSVGSRTVSAPAATDKAGNVSAVATASYSVVYKLSGLLSPWSPTKMYNSGSSIPLKWQYTDVAGNVVNSAGENPAVAISTVAGVPTPGASALQYDAVSKTWQVNWQTAKTQSGTFNVTISSANSAAAGPFAIQVR